MVIIKRVLVELLADVITKNCAHALSLLKADTIYISMENKTLRVHQNMASIDQVLSSNQEEADSKVILHSIHALHNSCSVVLRNT